MVRIRHRQPDRRLFNTRRGRPADTLFQCHRRHDNFYNTD